MMATLLLALTLSQGAHAGAASGREARQVQLDLASAMVEGGQPNAALGLIATLRQQGARGPDLDLLQARAARQAGLLDAAEAQLNALIEAARQPGFNVEKLRRAPRRRARRARAAQDGAA